MKRTPLKKKSKSEYRKLTDKADRALQDFYRREYPEGKCEVCGGWFDVMHHFVPKSQSSALRYDERNLIFICHGCHARHHRAGDPSVHGTIIKARGIDWYDDLMIAKRETIHLNKSYLKEVIDYYDSLTNTGGA